MTPSEPARGLVVVDKPEGPSSFAAVASVRHAFKTREVGHCGTLDPLASGVLVVAVGSFTRLVRVLTSDDKRYTAVVRFGTSTTTDDREGEVVARAAPEDVARLSRDEVERALAQMVGPQLQVPPAYSAIHVQGERAYERARRGEAVEMTPRDVVIHGLGLAVFHRDDAGVRATVDVHCGKGTYVRAIARDLGARLGVPAHLEALRRTASGAYTLDDAVTLEALMPAALRSDVGFIRGIPCVAVTDDEARALRMGKRIPRRQGSEPGGQEAHVTMLAHAGDDLVALVRTEGGALVVERGFPAP